MILYEFRGRIPTLRRSIRVVIRGNREEIENYIHLDEFSELFGGFIIWGSQLPVELPATQWLGVWGSRTARRFRRILRERGARLTCVRETGPELPVAAVHQANR